jgi:hypothetical protein
MVYAAIESYCPQYARQIPGPGWLPRRVPDLLDANESTWAFGADVGVGWAANPQLRRLETLASYEGCRSYCGRAADAIVWTNFPERGGAGRTRRQALAVRGHPPPLSSSQPACLRHLDHRHIHLDDGAVEVYIIELTRQHDRIASGDQDLCKRQRRNQQRPAKSIYPIHDEGR